GLQKHVEVDEPEEDNMAALMAGQEWSEAIGPDDKTELEGVEIITADAGEQMGTASANDEPKKDASKDGAAE
ncbi:MAG: hypothetical protein HOH89_02555, partial [Alphaproteobacteria bacterium]|nr:hypothetical protein [Alphaproteobacteria bacterium]